jgi:hypothetical protein
VKKALLFLLLLLAAAALVVLFVAAPAKSEHDPKDLQYWMKTAGTNDWSAQAAAGDPRAQLLHGLTLVRSNFVMARESVPKLRDIPLIGRKLFENTSYAINDQATPAELEAAHAWIAKAAAQNFQPALEAEKLFVGKLQPPALGTNTSTLAK